MIEKNNVLNLDFAIEENKFKYVMVKLATKLTMESKKKIQARI